MSRKSSSKNHISAVKNALEASSRAEVQNDLQPIPQESLAQEKDIAAILAKSTSDKITPQSLLLLRTAFSLGWNHTDACLFAGIPRSVFFDFLKSNPLLQAYIDAWQLSPRHKANKVLIDSLDSPDEKIRVTSAKFILEHIDPQFIKKSVNDPANPRGHTDKLFSNHTPLSKEEQIKLSNLIQIKINAPDKTTKEHTIDITPSA